MPCEERPHPLPHDGTSQPERALAAAQASYVRPDERETADWIVAAGKLSKHIAFFDGSNKPGGDWSPFFEGSETALLALLAVQDVDAYRRSIGERFTRLRARGTSEDDLKAALGEAFSGVLSLAKALDGYYGRLPQSAPFRLPLGAVITGSLRPALKSLLRYYKAGLAKGLLAGGNLNDWRIFDAPVKPAASILSGSFSALWIEGNVAWNSYYSALSEDGSIYGDAGWSTGRQISQAASHNLFTGVFDRFLSGLARLVKEGGAAVQKVLEGEGTHAPHYALFLTFLKLYRHAQEGFNTFGQRHLDFYYKNVLRLARRPSQPSSAHLLIELAKATPEILLPRNTLFKGGKDSAGNEVLYALDEDTLVNRAKVARIASLYRGTAADNKPGVNNAGRLFYSPVSGSADGLGAELKTSLKDWHPYALRDAGGKLTMPKAAVGFAVASHYLALAEGYRVIRVKLPTASGSFPATLALDCYLTTEKGWHKVTDATLVDVQTSEATPAPCKAVQITLSGEVPPITAWDAKVHGGNFGAAVPVLKMLLRQEDGAAYAYGALAGISLRGVEIEVRVGVSTTSDAAVDGGLKSLTLSGDLGPLDGSKPFLPFGPEPKTGSSFIVGSEEAFRKAGARMQLRATWLDRPATSDYVYEGDGAALDVLAAIFGLTFLSAGLWDNPAALDLSFGIPFGSSPTGDLFTGLLELPATSFASWTEPYGPYSLASRSGFLRFQTLIDFGHEAYRKALGKFQAGGGADPGVPPYTPKLSSLTLHYKASVFLPLTGTDRAAFDARSLRFFHLHPGGEAEQHALLTGAATLLPQLVHQEGGNTISHAGELYIGVQDLAGGQSVSLLVQVLEGTTDPLVAKPAKHLSWSYLAANVWKPFGEGAVTDGTDGMIRSGIVELVVPLDARTDNTLLAPGLLWIRVSIGSDAGAIARLLSIDAGAARVTLQGAGYAPDFLQTALPAGTIAKLKVPQAAVKKVTQPYTSFGGRQEEDAPAFYQRAAERLRHRDRAVALWDYEHLVLQAFPQIHRAKCLPHTSFANGVYRENAPGSVTIVTIPSLVNRRDADLLKPYTHEDTLQDIRDFLGERMTAQAALYVTHPQFEEVELSFLLKLLPGHEFNFYRKKLREEITGFLSPWAFSNSAEVEFGSRIRKSVIIDFIEERPYVDFITEVKMYHTIGAVKSGDMDEVTASTARSVLVSVPAEKHGISEAPAAASAPAAPPCVDTYTASELG